MAKKNRKKSRAKNLVAQKQLVKPDDYFRYGHIEMARFGKFLVSRSNLSKDQFEEMQNRLVEHNALDCLVQLKYHQEPACGRERRNAGNPTIRIASLNVFTASPSPYGWHPPG
jgi:hypothetical protein